MSEDFRQAMRRMASTIAIVTAGKGDDWLGMAATAVMSVTFDPPTIVVAVNKTASIFPTMSAQDEFCVNLLSTDQRDLVGLFSGPIKGLARFANGGWVASEEGLPVLPEALASIVCRKVSIVDAASHVLFFGEVKRTVNHPEIKPLVWVDGGFGKVEPLPA